MPRTGSFSRTLVGVRAVEIRAGRRHPDPTPRAS